MIPESGHNVTDTAAPTDDQCDISNPKPNVEEEGSSLCDVEESSNKSKLSDVTETSCKDSQKDLLKLSLTTHDGTDNIAIIMTTGGPKGVIERALPSNCVELHTNGPTDGLSDMVEEVNRMYDTAAGTDCRDNEQYKK